ncbi:peptidyl-prolyl cis-trans isomerase FKBP53-like [Nymphaea colorata]|nr:peptidyl-prolyl cis-trans isomerase FKBP53-like [Nymphaea colorata]
MAFWGVQIRSGQPFTLQSANQNGRLHISQATLGDGSSPKKSILQCNVGKNAPVLLCSLLPDRLESCSLNLEFEEEEVVVFSVLGPRSIHLSGYHIVSSHTRDENDSDSYGENIDIESETDEESSYYDSEDECDDFIVDDDESLEFDTSPKHVSGVKIEEIIDDEEPEKVNDGSKLQNRRPCPTAERKFLTVEDSSEDEDGLFISTGRRKNLSKVVEANENLDRQLQEENVGERPANDEKCHSTCSKRRRDSSEKGLEHSRKSKKKKEKGMMKEDPGSGPDMPVDNASNNASNSQDQSGLEHGAGDGEHGNIAVSKSAVDCSILEVEEPKKKKKKKNSAETGQNIDTDQSKVASSGNKGELEEVPLLEDHADGPLRKEARTFPNGLIIEEISMGKPDGRRASPGMKVSVHYIGKLKKNGSIIDSSVGRKPFKFCLGIGEVIKGWDVGINGMRVGDKRRLTIPPSMGYGSTGTGKIPGNAWLVFDVELVNVR